jgi:hypothetical protein
MGFCSFDSHDHERMAGTWRQIADAEVRAAAKTRSCYGSDRILVNSNFTRFRQFHTLPAGDRGRAVDKPLIGAQT